MREAYARGATGAYRTRIETLMVRAPAKDDGSMRGMPSRHSLLARLVVGSAAALVTVACGSSGGDNGFGSGDGDGGAASGDGSGGGNPNPGDASFGSNDSSNDSSFDPDAFWANDPAPKYCYPDGGGTTPQPPGGTPDCPDDKNRQGCACPTNGQTAACWPGLRVNRSQGVCHDGTTTCAPGHEGLGLQWGPCVGYQLPTPGATKGAAACQCFSSGQWAIKNLSPCFIGSGSSYSGAVSTYIDGLGKAQCPDAANLPNPQPGTTWSSDTLKVDCAGEFTLCYTLKAGDSTTPKATDCVLTKQCTTGFYPTKGQVTPFPDLASWTSSDASCATQFATTGGYGEMSVKGKSVLCEAVDDGNGNDYVFNRVQYCPLACNQNPQGPGCQNCSQGGSGGF